ncbi:MAG: leucyl aminopeptidase [Rhodospirillaceae bacterium]|jgi:leucyl aminopeptidase|nr:leucyl aminopeptidase [Rhodospirillaceae bacterium]MBT5459744.1 leucyl aminopeptidase [Rhodospirillaceae bacterium]
MRLTFASPDLKRSGALVLFTTDAKTLSGTAQKLDKQTGGAIKRAMTAGRFKGSKGQALKILAPQGTKASQILLIGLGKAGDIDAVAAQNAGGSMVGALSGSADSSASVVIDAIKGCSLSAADFAANAAYGAQLRSYRFDKYRTKEKSDDKPSLNAVCVMTGDVAKARRVFGPLSKIAGGVFLTRDLVSEPANVIYPTSFAARARSLSKLGVKIQILDEKQMAKLGMGALLGVGQGSAKPSRIVAMRWNGAPKAKDKRPIAFVGKGVTFDTGGISIKPAGGMEDMKWDMAGAGVVAGLMHALAARKAKVNAVGVCALAENMPSSNAQRPGDVVKTMSGQTIEVINTDAEGRLVLSDAMWWCQQVHKPHTMIDLATLTGAIIVSLGHHHAGLFANNDKLAEQLDKAGKATGEAVWRMPLGAAYDKQVRSQIADMKNVGGRDAGSITAAQILQRFVKDDVAWAHLDIAGVAWANSDSPTAPRGGTAFGVRLLDRLVADYYEKG